MSAPVVVGVDDSAHGIAVAQAAATLAGALDRSLLLVHAAPDPPTFPYGDARERELQRWHATREGEDLLDRTRDALPRIAVRTRVVLGDHRSGLATVAKEENAALLVIGASGRWSLGAARTGSRVSELAAMSSRPVMVVPTDASDAPADGRSPGSIVCGVDGSPASMKALEVARALAGPLGLTLVPVFADRIHPRPEGVGKVVMEIGSARRAIKRVAARRNGRMIVVGSRGRGRLLSALLGSVSAAVARSAGVPVVVVPPGARTGDLVDASRDAEPADRSGSGAAPRVAA